MAFDDLPPGKVDDLTIQCAHLINEYLKAFVQAQPAWDITDTMFLTDRILTDMYRANRAVILTIMTSGRHYGEDEDA